MDQSPRERAALVALLRIGRRPWPHYAELIEEAGSAAAMLDQELANRQTSLLVDPPDLEVIEREIRAWDGEGMRLLTLLDAEYPANLLTVHDRTPLLFVGGSLDAGDERSVAVEGTRPATEEGLAAAREISAHR